MFSKMHILKVHANFSNFSSEVKHCYEVSNTFIGVENIHTQEFSIEDNKTLFLEFLI